MRINLLSAEQQGLNNQSAMNKLYRFGQQEKDLTWTRQKEDAPERRMRPNGGCARTRIIVTLLLLFYALKYQ